MDLPSLKDWSNNATPKKRKEKEKPEEHILLIFPLRRHKRPRLSDVGVLLTRRTVRVSHSEWPGGEEWNKDVRWNSHRYDRFKNFLTRCSVVKLLRLRGTNSSPEPGSPQAVGHAPATHLWTGRIHQPSLLSQITSDRDVGDMEQSNVEWGRRAAHNARWQIPWLARPCESRLTPCGHGGPTHARQRSPRRWWGGPHKSTCGQSG